MAELVTRTLSGTDPTAALVLANPPRTLMRMLVPADWDAADVLVEEQLGESWGPLKEADGSTVRVVAAAGDVVRLDECLFQHARSIRFRSSASQGGTRTLQVQVVRLSEVINGTVS